MTDNAERDAFISRLKSVLCENLMLDRETASRLSPSDDLFDPPYNLDARNLAYLVVLLERLYRQKVTAHSILHSRLSTVEALQNAFCTCGLNSPT